MGWGAQRSAGGGKPGELGDDGESKAGLASMVAAKARKSSTQKWISASSKSAWSTFRGYIERPSLKGGGGRKEEEEEKEKARKPAATRQGSIHHIYIYS